MQERYGDSYHTKEQTRQSALDIDEPPHQWVS